MCLQRNGEKTDTRKKSVIEGHERTEGMPQGAPRKPRDGADTCIPSEHSLIYHVAIEPYRVRAVIGK